MSQPDISIYLNNWLAFFEPKAPCGENIELEPEFDALQEEVGRDSSIHADRPTDWGLVLEQADALLARSKDIWPFVYGVIALNHICGLQGCTEGISSLSTFLQQAWDTAYPRPDRLPRRLAPLRWLQGKLSQYAELTSFIGEPTEAVQACAKALQTLQSLIDEKAPDNDLSFTTVLSSIERMSEPVEEQPADAPAPALVEASVEKKPAVREARPAPVKSAAVSSSERDGRIPAGALPQVIRTFNDTARQLGDHLLAVQMTDERGYLMHRACCWSTLLQLPTTDDQKRSQLVCPAEPDRIAAYNSAIEEKRFAEVLPQIEKTASKAPFWLDGHYMVARCLEGLDAQGAAICVKHALAQLLNRFPDLLEFRFKDGQPFASPRTVTWLDAVVQSTFAGPHTGYSAGITGSSYDKAGDELLLQQAISLNAEESFEAGLALLGHVPPGKNRAALRHALLKARYCLAAGRKNSARNMLVNIYNDLDRWKLFDWEPKVSAAVISLLLTSMPKTQQADREELLTLLHKYNLAEALKMTLEA